MAWNGSSTSAARCPPVAVRAHRRSHRAEDRQAADAAVAHEGRAHGQDARSPRSCTGSTATAGTSWSRRTAARTVRRAGCTTCAPTRTRRCRSGASAAGDRRDPHRRSRLRPLLEDRERRQPLQGRRPLRALPDADAAADPARRAVDVTADPRPTITWGHPARRLPRPGAAVLAALRRRRARRRVPAVRAPRVDGRDRVRRPAARVSRSADRVGRARRLPGRRRRRRAAARRGPGRDGGARRDAGVARLRRPPVPRRRPSGPSRRRSPPRSKR